MSSNPTQSHPLDQLACALTLAKLVRMLEVGLNPKPAQAGVREGLEGRSEEFIRGVRFSQEQAKLLSQCFAPGLPEHPFPLNGAEQELKPTVPRHHRHAAKIRQHIQETLAKLPDAHAIYMNDLRRLAPGRSGEALIYRVLKTQIELGLIERCGVGAYRRRQEIRAVSIPLEPEVGDNYARD